MNANPKQIRRWLGEIGIEYRSGYRPTGVVERYVKDTGSWRNGTGRRPKIYNTWIRMRHRCYSKACKDYRYYGGRGIKMCDEWRRDYDAFRTWALRNGVRKELTLDRIDNDGNYEPGNCRWISQSEQNLNKRYVVTPRRRTFTPEQLELVKLRRRAGESLGALAAEYGLSSGHICKLVGRVTNKGRWPNAAR